MQEAIRLNYFLPLNDTVSPIKIDNIDFVLFKTKGVGVVVDFVCKENGERYDMYEMSVKAYNDYENYMRTNSI